MPEQQNVGADAVSRGSSTRVRAARRTASRARTPRRAEPPPRGRRRRARQGAGTACRSPPPRARTRARRSRSRGGSKRPRSGRARRVAHAIQPIFTATRVALESRNVPGQARNGLQWGQARRVSMVRSCALPLSVEREGGTRRSPKFPLRLACRCSPTSRSRSLPVCALEFGRDGWRSISAARRASTTSSRRPANFGAPRRHARRGGRPCSR